MRSGEEDTGPPQDWCSRPHFSHRAGHTGGGLLLNKLKRELFNLMSHVNCTRWADGREVAGMGLSVHICVASDYMESSPLKNRQIRMGIMFCQNRLDNKMLENIIRFETKTQLSMSI